MKRLALAFILCLLAAPLSFAQQTASLGNPEDAPATREDIERYLDAMHTRELMRSTMDAMIIQTHKTMHDMLARQPGLPPDAEAQMDKMMDDILSELPLDDLIDAMIPVYQKHFTRGDIAALTAFYSTPTGQKVVKELPAITAESMQAVSHITESVMTRAMDRAQQQMAEMLKNNPPRTKPRSSSTQN